jgi:hypothetical protein
LTKQIEQSESELRQLPDKIAVKHLLAENEIIQLETERKILTDSIKMICYRAETCLMNLIAPFLARNNDEGSDFVKSVFQQPADIIPDEREQRLTVRFHTMSTARENRALKKLCEIMNEESYVYPGTQMILVFMTQ